MAEAGLKLLMGDQFIPVEKAKQSSLEEAVLPFWGGGGEVRGRGGPLPRDQRVADVPPGPLPPWTVSVGTALRQALPMDFLKSSSLLLPRTQLLKLCPVCSQ